MRSNNKKFLLAIVAVLLPTMIFAATSNNEDTIGGYNTTIICLVSLMLILLFVIGMLANTLRQLGLIIRDRVRKEKSNNGGIIKTVIMLFAFSITALQVFAADVTDKAAAPAVTSINGVPVNDFYTIMAMIILEIGVIFALVIYIKILLKGVINKPELAPAAIAIAKKSWFWDKFNAAAKLEEEKDILLDHNYDGIQELDNSLPPWWKYGFYLTIIVAVIYLYRFHVSHDGLSQSEEYTVEMQKAEVDKAAYLAKSANNVDESNVTALTDANSIAAGKEIFIKTCAPCHLADGGGIVGPNLTDEYWLHGGGIKDIFKSIKYGWQDKGMKSWKDDFAPKQIQELASFVKSLKGTHPAAPKAPQGDIYIEAAQPGNITDSIKTKKEPETPGKVAVK